MAIADDDVAAVRAATDLAALIGERVGLRRQGRRMVGLCPFHAERTPSFAVDAGSGFYHCFGCGASGDAISFVRATEQLDFQEAVERLAARAGITLRPTGRVDPARGRRRRLEEVVEAAVELYHRRLLEAPDAGPAREYLRSRGIDEPEARLFRLGWAPEGWDVLCRALGLAADLARDAGLGFTNRSGRLQDLFRGRVIFPIFDAGGRAVALGGRALPGADGDVPKYINSPEGPLYSKRRILYGLNWAKSEAATSAELVVCEGYFDVLAFHSVGIHRAVAPCGTALGEEHLAQLARFARRLVLAFDADGAGTAAAERLYAWERQHDLELRVATLPAGRDPADLAREGPEELRSAVAGARPYLEFRIERLLALGDQTTTEGRARTASQALELVAEHPDPLVRDGYVMALADRCRLPAQHLRSLLAERRRQAAAPAGRERLPVTQPARRPSTPAREGRTLSGAEAGAPAQGPGGAPLPPARGPALEALRLAVLRPELVSDRLDPVCFPEGPLRSAFEAVLSADTLAGAVASAPAEAAELLRRLAVEEVEPDELAVGRLLQSAVRAAAAEIGAAARADPSAFAEWASQHNWLMHQAMLLVPGPAPRAAEQALVAWLRARSEGGA